MPQIRIAALKNDFGDITYIYGLFQKGSVRFSREIAKGQKRCI